MFTLEAINRAHDKVHSGADFPAYIRELRQLGVDRYEIFVTDGHTNYYGAGAQVTAPAKYDPFPVSGVPDPGQFLADLKHHQQGATDYPTFCADCARSGVEKWVVAMDQMTCTYYDTAGNIVLTEAIPE